MSVEPKLWKDRDFDECCHPVSGFGNATMVCAEPTRGSYCAKHRSEIDAVHQQREAKRRESGKIKRATRSLARRPAAPVVVQIPPARKMSLRVVAELVARKHQVSVDDLLGPSTKGYIRPARREFYYLARETGKSYPQIAAFCGGRDHTSVMAGDRKYRAALEVEIAA